MQRKDGTIVALHHAPHARQYRQGFVSGDQVVAAKEIKFANDARTRMLRGVNLIADVSRRRWDPRDETC